jgi:DNA-directed RNA polymerase beta subunit
MYSDFARHVLRKDFKLRTCVNFYLASVIYYIGYLMDDASVISHMHMNEDFLKSWSSACLAKSLNLGIKT